jgi:hypothetical protein
VYSGRPGHALIDRELCLLQGWIDDPDRMRVAGVPAQVGFATKPALAAQMIGRTLDAGVPAAWVAGDEVYGANPALRAELQARSIGYVLAVGCDHPVVAGGDTYHADACSGLTRRGRGSRSPAATAPRATATTTGRSSASTTTTMLRLANSKANTG